MSALLSGLREPGARAFAAEYDARPFVGRAAALAALDAWLDRPDAPSRLVLCAEAGRGKSALLLRWAAARAGAGARVAWAPVSLRFETARTTALDRALTGRLAALGSDGRHWADAAASGRPLLLVLDGLDEALDDGLEAALRALPERPGLRVVVSARRLLDRDAAGWAARLGWPGAELLGLGGLEREEVGALAGAGGDALTRLVQATGGDPLLVSLQAGLGEPVEGGLEALFARWWAEQQRAWAERGADLGPLTGRLLAVLGCALGPVEPALLAAAVDAAPDEVERALAPLGRFVVRAAGGAVAPAHPRLGAFFRERLSDAEARAVDLRLAELGRADLDAGRTPPAYLVRWLRVHLERLGDAAGVQALIRPEWLEAHRALEGGDAGFLDDLRAAWRLADLRFAREGSAALADQAHCLLYRAALAGSEAGVDEDLRAELVRHGLRSERAALRSLEGLEGWEHDRAVSRLLPVLSDDAFRELLEGAEPGRGWPVAAIARRLRALGDEAEACAWLCGERAARLDRYAAQALLPELPGASRARLRDALAAEPEPEVETEQARLEALLARARLLEPSRRDPLLDEVEAGLSELPEAELGWDDYYGGTDPRLELAEALIEAGAPGRAEPWLARAAAWPFPFSEVPREEQEPSAPWARAAAGLGRVPPALEATVARLLAAPDDPKAGIDPAEVRLALAPLLPEPERAALLQAELARARARADETLPLQRLALLPGRGPVAEAAADAWAERVEDLARRDRGPDATYALWYELSQRALGALPDLAPLVPAARVRPLAAALEAWVAAFGPDSHGRDRLGSPWSLHVLHTLLRRDPALASERLAAWAALPGAPVWRVAGWEEALPAEVRRARLERELRARPRLADPRAWVERLAALAAALPEAERGPLAELAARLARRAGPESLAKVAAFAPDALQAALAEELLAAAPAEPDARNALLSGALPGLRDPGLRARVARRMAEVPEGQHLGSSPWWLEPASAALPEAEWEALLRGLLAREVLGEGALFRTYLPPGLRAEAREATRPPEEKLGDYAIWLNWHAPDLPAAERDARYAALLARLEPLLREAGPQPDSGAADSPPWYAADALADGLRPEELAALDEALATGAGPNLRSRLVARWAGLGERARAERHLAALRARPGRGVDLLSAELQLLAPGRPLAEVLAGAEPQAYAYPWVIARVAALGRAAEHARLAVALPPSERLSAWAGLWPHLAEPERAALRDAVALAAAEEQSKPNLARRLLALGALTDAQVARLWARDGADGGLGAFPVAYYARFGAEALRAAAARVAAELGRLA